MKLVSLFLVAALAAGCLCDERLLSSDEIDSFIVDEVHDDHERTVDEIIRDAGTAEGAAQAAGERQMVNVQMDMVMDPLQYEVNYKNLSISGFAGAAMESGYWRWPKAVIPYTIDRVFGDRGRNVIYGAMKEWQEKTCIRFEPAGSAGTKNLGHRDNIRFVNGRGCFSMIGWVRGGHQVSLSLNGCVWHSTALHEIGHTIGLHHEQCRPDRDNALVIQLQNVERNMRFNFDKKRGTSNFGMPYDYCSIMHYGPYAFSYNRKMAVITRNQDFQFSIGAEKHLTYTDERIVNHMYGCSKHCSADANCKEPCYQNHKCQCICPKPCPKRPCTSRLSARDCQGIKNYLGNKLKAGDYGNGVPEGSGPIGPVGPTGPTGPTSPPGEGEGPNCRNNNDRCGEWADRGECDKNSHYMIPNCPKACGFCKNCGDQNDRCQEWADRGECENNPWYMLPHCNKACQLCR